MATTTSRVRKTFRSRRDTEHQQRVEVAAKQRLLTDCPYAFYFRQISCVFNRGTLTVRGRVPTFYLKQVLQTRLQGLAGVQQVRNEVDVVSSVGLSSVRAR